MIYYKLTINKYYLNVELEDDDLINIVDRFGRIDKKLLLDDLYNELYK
jgi:hypothetical protein